MAQRQLNCIFCGASSAEVEMTKEDVISKWLDDVLTEEVVGASITAERTVVGPGAAEIFSRSRAYKLSLIKIAAVCRPCNNIWMGAYDGKVKHWLAPMILGNSASLSTEQQMVIATWATLKVMVLEFQTRHRVFTQAQREFLMRQAGPPTSVQVRVAAMESTGMPVQVRHRLYAREDRVANPQQEDLSICATLVFGCFVVQVFGGSFTGDSVLRRMPANGPGYLQIWPPHLGSVFWPPRVVLKDSDIDAFGNPLGA